MQIITVLRVFDFTLDVPSRYSVIFNTWDSVALYAIPPVEEEITKETRLLARC